MNLYRTFFLTFFPFFTYSYTSSIARKALEAVCFQTDSTFLVVGNDVTTKTVSSLVFAFPPSRKGARLPILGLQRPKAPWLRSCIRYSKFKQAWRRAMTEFPPSGLASSNTGEMMTKSRFWPIPIHSFSYKNVVFPTQAENILVLFIDYSLWHFRFRMH